MYRVISYQVLYTEYLTYLPLFLSSFVRLLRSECDDIVAYFGDVNSVSEIDLGDVTTVECPANDEGGMLDEILIQSGKSLTIKSSRDYVR